MYWWSESWEPIHDIHRFVSLGKFPVCWLPGSIEFWGCEDVGHVIELEDSHYDAGYSEKDNKDFGNGVRNERRQFIAHVQIILRSHGVNSCSFYECVICSTPSQKIIPFALIFSEQIRGITIYVCVVWVIWGGSRESVHKVNNIKWLMASNNKIDKLIISWQNLWTKDTNFSKPSRILMKEMANTRLIASSKYWVSSEWMASIQDLFRKYWIRDLGHTKVELWGCVKQFHRFWAASRILSVFLNWIET